MGVVKKKQTLSVLVPVYNERETVGLIIKKLETLAFVSEIVAVDDGSTDGTFEILAAIKSRKLRVFRQEKNAGKTAAIKRAARESSGDLLIIQDADLEYDPGEIPSVVGPLFDGVADVVYGSRFLVKKATRVLYYYHYVANKFLTHLSNGLTNLNMTDIETCYKAFRAPILKNMELASKGFGMEVEITAAISKFPLRIFEFPISYYGRTYEEGKKIGIKDGLLAIWYILYYNLIYFRTSRGRKYIADVKDEIET
jgi:glycosyltransferase involved in cell wall biosynthesis